MGYSIRTKNERYTRWINWQSRKTIAEELYDYSSSQSAVLSTGHLVEHENIAPRGPESLDQMRNKLNTLLGERQLRNYFSGTRQ